MKVMIIILSLSSLCTQSEDVVDPRYVYNAKNITLGDTGLLYSWKPLQPGDTIYIR